MTSIESSRGSSSSPKHAHNRSLLIVDKQQEELQVCENNWIRRIAGVKRIDKRRMEELREEVGVRESLTRKLV